VAQIRAGQGINLKKAVLRYSQHQGAHTDPYWCRGSIMNAGIVFKSPMDPKNLAEDYKHLYPQKDFHTLYFGEILECYSTADERIK